MTTNADVLSYGALIDQLSAEHAELLPCTDRILDVAASAGPELRDAIESCIAKLQAPLEAHIAQEDDVLFPAYARASGSDGLVAQFRNEHRDIIALRDEMMTALDSGNARKLGSVAEQLAELLGDHMRREDMMLFPSARDALRE
jgi:iron-sulfur cluster repair protein YtfE (RIC family)